MGLLDRFKAKESRFTAWLKSELHMAALPPELRGEEELLPFLGRLSGERLLLKLEPDHADAIVSLGLDDRGGETPVLAHLFRQDLADLRQTSLDAHIATALPPGWVLDTDSDATLGVLVVAPKAFRKLLEACSQRVRTLSFHGQGLSASLHLHREEPQRLTQDLANLLELLRFQRDPKEEAAAEVEATADAPAPSPESHAPTAEPEAPAATDIQLDLLGEPEPTEAHDVAPVHSDHPLKVHVTVQANGPLIIDGPLDVEKADGSHLQVDEPHPALCRCGKSSNKPFCDGTHKKIGFLAK